MEFVLSNVSLVKGMAWKVHVIIGAGKPSAEHDKLTAEPINASTSCGTVRNRG